jgi:uncharacterized protein
MLGFSIQKLLVLAAVIGAVWYAFKFVGRLQQARDAEAKGGGAKRAKTGNLGDQLRDWLGGKGKGDAGSAGQAEDLVPCPKCGAYVAAHGATSCGRSDCPY